MSRSVTRTSFANDSDSRVAKLQAPETGPQDHGVLLHEVREDKSRKAPPVGHHDQSLRPVWNRLRLHPLGRCSRAELRRDVADGSGVVTLATVSYDCPSRASSIMRLIFLIAHRAPRYWIGL